MTQYQYEFIALSNQVIGLLDTFLISCYIFGLKPTHKWELQIAKHKSIVQAMALAKMHEAKFNNRVFTKKSIYNTALSADTNPIQLSYSSNVASSSTMLNNGKNTKTQLHIKKLT